MSKFRKITSPNAQHVPRRTLANGKDRRLKQSSTKTKTRLSMQQTQRALSGKKKARSDLVSSIQRLAMLERTLNQNQIKTIAREAAVLQMSG